MKNRHHVHAHQSARIYRHYYKPSFNLIRFFRAILSIIISGNSHAAGHYTRKN